jgi:hypothetical protein
MVGSNDPMSVGMLLAWMLLIIAGAVGTTMVVVGMIEEVPSIVRWTLQRTMKRRQRS